ncbi:hypothetical protein Aph02nite_09270 [Actinoplanes philippinensis]|nr:non-ribosomal peptide synthetase/type I polyketide synthase [Actinoplanes philippinensis]GIE74977.1 hypothetical protein Aph02nite_09270 [Actinoplanes philippinensis]
MTLTDLLLRATTEVPGQGVVHADRFVSYAELLGDALRIGGGLREAGVAPGDPLPIVAGDGGDFLALFWGAIVAGAVPVPLPPEPHRLAAVWRHLDRPPLAGDTATPGGTLLSPRDLRSASPLTTPHPVRADDLAFLQFSSGSTGTPKGVELTHANVLANLSQAARAGALTSDDVFVTWMPYFHDMGLIGTHLAPLYARCRQVRISPLAFAKRPELWLRAAAEHRATVLSAANFALALVNRRVPQPLLDTLDLSSVRLLMVGAEPISPSVWQTFTTRLRPTGLCPGAMQPVYGLAEATVAVACPPLGEPAVPVALSRAALARGVALPVSPPPSAPSPSPTPSPDPAASDPAASVPAPPALPSSLPDDSRVVLLMDVGHPVPGCELRVVDDQGTVLEDGLVGHLQVRGPNVTRGYHRDPAATAAAFDGDWLRTGDIGFLRTGRLVITGRHKDVLFINGRNFHAADLEEVAAATPGLAPGPTAVVGATDPSSGRERVTVFVAAPAVRSAPADLPARIRARVAEALAHDDVHVEVVPTTAFTRTTSGKLRRHPFRERLGTAPATPEATAPTPPPDPAAAPGSSAPEVRPELSSEVVEPMAVAGTTEPLRRADVERIVREIWARVLRTPVGTIGPDDRFLAIGGSSLKAMEVLAELEDAFGRTLDPAMLRDCATVPALADRLLDGFPEEGRAPGGRRSATESRPGDSAEAEPADADGPRSPAGTAIPAAAGDDRGALAIVGMACRFPDADTPEQFWANLVAGRDSVTGVSRWPGGGHGAFLDDPAAFDAGCFGISDEEARLIDPHARIFLELAHEALEQAGYAGPRRKTRKIGIFAAVGESGYAEIVAEAEAGSTAGAFTLTGGLRNLIAARVAHLLDLRGPAITVDTACSSALVAVHLARRSLAAGDCDVAIVGGVNLNLTRTGETLLTAAQALSPTGRCRAFAADADGFVPGEGGAALVLTRLADAGDDRVLAVVRGSAVNNDGRSLSLMAPNPLLQREVIADAYRECGVDPADVTYVEAHGTGTAVGDPIEARSLAYAFPPRADGRARLLGSVKTNIGHLLNVAGLPALVKVILALQHRELPPSLHHDRPSPRFDLAAAGFEVVTARRPWTGPLVAGVNGFGFGGTNAHVILTAAAPAPEPLPPRDGPHLLTLSAPSEAGLRAVAARLATHLRNHPELRPADVCATASTARDDGPYRLAVVTHDDLAGRLATVEPRPLPPRPARVVFLFGGQGSQRPGQGARLYATAPVFRAVLDEVSAAAGPVAGRSVVAWCTDPDVPPAELARTEVTQPLVVAFGVAQAAQLVACGVRPAAVAGHSIGELAAAVTAGRLTAVEAVRLAVERGRRTAALTEPGAMLAVAASPAEIALDGVVVAAVNAPDRVVLAGSEAAVDRAAAHLERQGHRTRRLAVSHAFHSPAMTPVAEALAGLAPPAGVAVIPQLSTVTVEWEPSFDGAYLAAHAVGPVRFAEAVARLRTDGFDTMVEVGATVTLAPLVGATTVLPAGDDITEILGTAGELWLRGAPLNRAHLDTGTRRVPLPPYPFQRRRHWPTTPPTPPVLSLPTWVAAPLPAETGAGHATVVIAGSADPGDALNAITTVPRDGFLLLVTRDLFATGDNPPDPGHAIWSGLAMAFADENPHAAVRILDLSCADSPEAHRSALEQEITRPPVPGPAEIIARRSTHRLTRTFTPAPQGLTGEYSVPRVPAAAGRPAGEAPIAPRNGSYLIIGGAGAIGAEIARHLARRGRPTLLLAGRSAEPAALLAELRALGATADYRIADVAVEADVAALVAGRDFDVVLQAAGVVSPGSLRAKSAAEITAGVAAKVRGTIMLSRALGPRPPLVIALSSISSALPGLAGAVGDYVAGNAFLDTFAAAERAAGRPFVAVALPAVTGGGLATAHGLTPAGGALPIGQVPETLWAAAALGTAQVLVTSSAAALDRIGTLPAATAPQRQPPPLEPGRQQAGPAASGRDELVATVRELLAGPLEREPDGIGLDEPFLALGLDSLTAVDLVKELEKRLGRTLSTTLFFEYRTIGELADHLAGPVRFPFGPVQRAFVTTGRLYPEAPAYAYVRQILTGPVDAERLAHAFAELERRHPMLRVRFGPDGQHVAAPVPGRPAWFTVAPDAGVPDGEPYGEPAWEADLRNRVFDLGTEGPIRAVLAVEGERSRLVVVAHHAAVDGYSLAVLGDELWALYRGGELPPAPVATFAEHEAMRTGPSATDVDYWRTALAGFPRLVLPGDGDASYEPRGPYAVHQKALDPEVTRRLTATARDAGVSLFHLLLAGYVRCLARWSGQDAVPVSVARAGREARLPGVERMVGPFADTLPLLVRTRPGESATALAGRIRELWLTAEQHGSVSTIDLARALAADGAGPRTASPASFSFARFPNAGTTAAGVVATTAGTASAATRLGLVCFEAHGTLHFSWNHPVTWRTEAAVARLAEEHLAEITALARPRAGVVERIREQCRRAPGAIAVLTDGAPLTYRDLDVASDRLAGRLASGGSRRIGLLTGPGASTVIGVTGILKAGAAWVPMDAAHPPARLTSLLTRAGVSEVVHDAGTRAAAEALGPGFTLVDADAPGEHAPPPDTAGADGTAYVIFTSGSTGRPKGVTVSHRAMAGYLDWAITTFGYRPGDRLAQTASICFDASVRQILAPLLAGATVVCWDRDTVRDPELLVDRLIRDRVTVWSSVPTLWERLLTAAERSRADLSGLRWVHVGGEELSPAHVRRWFDLAGPGQRITNLYGPTETTINATWHLITERPADDVTRLPIGRPVGGAVIDVTGPDGEIWIGGDGLADGYLDDPEQTAAAFVERDGQRWYRSGDRGTLDADGVLWFRGRLDDQVKLHGHRIEPGEIEAVLRQHPAVDRVAVVVDRGRLTARVQSSSVDAAALRAYLRDRLPDYLLPARFEVVGELPLTVTGKIDRSRPVRGDTERLLAELWRRVLGVGSVGPEDDFFALGGDSIGVLELFTALAEHRTALPRPTVLYRHRTLAELAAVIDETPPGPAATGSVALGDFPVTPTQRGFLLADAIGAPSTWLAAPRLHGPLDVDRFRRAVNVLVARHPMLRTVFPGGARPPVQRELLTATAEIGYQATPRALGEELAAEREHRFDPAVWPLVRLRLLRYGPEEHVLLVHAHHLVGDGYSVALLMRELLALYDGAELPPLRATFREYVSRLEGMPAEIAPHDGGPIRLGGAIATATLTVDAAAATALRERAAAAGTTPFAPVLAAYHRALASVTGRPDPVIGVAVTGRDHAMPGLSRIFGPCATAVAVRPGPDAGPAEVAAAVTEARTRTFTAPQGWQHFFTHLDFGALGAPRDTTLRLSWDDADADLAVPPGTEVLLAVRPIDDGLRLTLRSRLPQPATDRLAAALADALDDRSAGRAATGTGRSRLDAGLVGYLPAPDHLPALTAALPEEIRQLVTGLDREAIRRMVFPGGRPRLLETVDTGLGRSGFIAVPRFADELSPATAGAPGPSLPELVAAAVDLAAGHGARTVSLAGMIPAHTGYGTAVHPYRQSDAHLTTGHAVTATAVVRTVMAALAARDRKLPDCVVAVLGVGSIGAASLSLLLARTDPPAKVILCDLPAATPRLVALAASLDVPAEVATAPDAVYRADVIVAATSSGPRTLDVNRLRPGTILVDDSFPHCFDVPAALARMRTAGDVLITGGGLLGCGDTVHESAPGLPAFARHLPGTMASCRLESLLHAAVPGLPLVDGPVTPEQAAAYWDALEAAGIGPAPLHLLNERLDTERDV